jgi:hypothetical protein
MRSYHVLLIALSVSASLAACAENPPSTLGATTGAGAGEPTPSPAQAYFEQNVAPIFLGTCADCHANTADEHGAPDFLGLSVEAYYGELTARTDFVSCDTANSVLLLKGADPGHAGPPLTDGQHDKVGLWLDLEADERFGGKCDGVKPSDAASTSTTVASSSSTGGMEEPPPLTGQVAMKQFGDCMTLEDWTATGMPLVANQISDYGGNDVPCYSCHNAGTGENWMPDPNGANAEADIAEAFEAMRYMYASFNLVRWTVNNEDGSFKDLVASQRWRDKGQEGTSHPSYTLSAEYQGYYEAWFTQVYDKWSSGECGVDGGGGQGGAGGGP